MFLPQVTSSDHKPILGLFSVTLPPVPRSTRPGRPTIMAHFTSLRCSELPVMDEWISGGKADPYITVYSDPTYAQPSSVSTKVVTNCLEPIWKAPLVVPLEVSSTSGVHLFLCVKDYDYHKADDVIGSACIELESCIADTSSLRRFRVFNLPLFNNGISKGRIAGRLELIKTAC